MPPRKILTVLWTFYIDQSGVDVFSCYQVRQPRHTYLKDVAFEFLRDVTLKLESLVIDVGCRYLEVTSVDWYAFDGMDPGSDDGYLMIGVGFGETDGNAHATWQILVFSNPPRKRRVGRIEGNMATLNIVIAFRN